MNYYTAVSPFWFVAISVCRRSGLLLIAVSPFWFVAVLVSPFWRVSVLVCRRFDHRPSFALCLEVIVWRKFRINQESFSGPSFSGPTFSVTPKMGSAGFNDSILSVLRMRTSHNLTSADCPFIMFEQYRRSVAQFAGPSTSGRRIFRTRLL